MNPIPLSSPNGTVYAYACGNCQDVASGGSFMCEVEPGRTAEYSRRNAAKCCLCLSCRAYTGRGLGTIWCAKCEAKSDKRVAERNAEYEAKEAALEAEHHAKTLNREASEKLCEYMSDMSEDHYCAGWLTGLGATLWRFAYEKAPERWGLQEVDTKDLQRLRTLSELCGGWWIHDATGKRFLTLAEWAQMRDRGEAPS